ncbi:hypothetical protein TNCV_3753291 [Trichonephila clavipes]|nr:hypothetical protein TNCV_3753291 [Trichonephila clavipes]
MDFGRHYVKQRTPLHFFDVDSVTAQRYKNEVLQLHVMLVQAAIGQDYIFMVDNTRLCTELIFSKTFLRKRIFAREKMVNKIS